MKKRISVILVMILCLSVLSFTGCRSGAGAGSGSSADPKAPFEATIDEVFICTTSSGDVLIVNFEVTNLSDEYVEGNMVAYGLSAELDGTALDSTYLDTEDENYINSDKKIAADESAILQARFELGSAEEGEINLLGLTYGDGDDYDKQIEFINETIDLSDVEKLVAESSFELSVDDVVKTDDGEGTDLIIIDMTFTNNSDEVAAYAYDVKFEIFQNGTSLKSESLPYNHPAVDDDLRSNKNVEVQSGVSIKVREVYALLDPSTPIEIKAIEGRGYGVEPILENEIQIK